VADLFLWSVIPTSGEAGVSHAAGKKETPATKTVPGEEPKQAFDAHETTIRCHFKDADRDFTFGSLVIGATVNCGCEIGEAFRTAASIKDGDAASWQKECARTAGHVEARGDRSLPNKFSFFVCWTPKHSWNAGGPPAFSVRKHRKGSEDGDRQLESCYTAKYSADDLAQAT
jgi:hypothetical protein